MLRCAVSALLRHALRALPTGPLWAAVASLLSSDPTAPLQLFPSDPNPNPSGALPALYYAALSAVEGNAGGGVSVEELAEEMGRLRWLPEMALQWADVEVELPPWETQGPEPLDTVQQSGLQWALYSEYGGGGALFFLGNWA